MPRAARCILTKNQPPLLGPIAARDHLLLPHASDGSATRPSAHSLSQTIVTALHECAVYESTNWLQFISIVPTRLSYHGAPLCNKLRARRTNRASNCCCKTRQQNHCIYTPLRNNRHVTHCHHSPRHAPASVACIFAGAPAEANDTITSDSRRRRA